MQYIVILEVLTLGISDYKRMSYIPLYTLVTEFAKIRWKWGPFLLKEANI